jgi:hypothetical protein
MKSTRTARSTASHRWVRFALASLLFTGTAVSMAEETMRLDYYHTGGQGQELFAVDRVVREPLPWPGRPDGHVDTTGSGPYRFEVRDSNDRLLYSRGYSSIYAEWELTAEAGNEHRTFHESLRFPAPKSPVKVVVQKRRPDQSFATVWTTTVDPGDMFVRRAPATGLTPIELERHGEPQDKVDLLLLGDGYTASQCADKFRRDASRLLEALFEHEPFSSRRNDFNVWGLCPPSPEPGISRPSTGIQRETAVGTTYDAFGSERYVLTFDNRALRDVAQWAPNEFIEILVNAETYGGGGILGNFATVTVDNDWADYLFVHEFGHHFAALADEYYTSPVETLPVQNVVEPWEPNVTALLDPAQLKWRDLVTPGTALPTPWPKQEFEAKQREFQARRKQIRAERRPESEMSALFREEREYTTRLLQSSPNAKKVGAFQGANYESQVFYRSQADCVMFTRDEVPFCRVCQRAIGQVIDLYAGPAAPAR